MSKLDFLENMLRIRNFEERCAELYGEMKIRGFLHLYIGEEAISAGVMPVLGAEDAVVTTYREHGHALLRGIPMQSIMAEMFGKIEGCSRGRGGSMHLFDAKTRFFGGNAIVAGGMPIAVGLALAEKLSGRKNIAACFFGDGAVAEGEFHESMNLASLWKLPVLFLCENNQYAMGTALSRHQAETNLSKKAEAYAMPALRVDGMDVLAVHEAAKQAYDYTKEGRGPFFIEFLTYRFRAHSMYDPDLYRTKQEVEEWKKRDPIAAMKEKLLSEGALNETIIRQMEEKAKAEIDAAIAYAELGTLEPLKELERFVYAERQAL